MAACLFRFRWVCLPIYKQNGRNWKEHSEPFSNKPVGSKFQVGDHSRKTNNRRDFVWFDYYRYFLSLSISHGCWIDRWWDITVEVSVIIYSWLWEWISGLLSETTPSITNLSMALCVSFIFSVLELVSSECHFHGNERCWFRFDVSRVKSSSFTDQSGTLPVAFFPLFRVWFIGAAVSNETVANGRTMCQFFGRMLLFAGPCRSRSTHFSSDYQS